MKRLAITMGDPGGIGPEIVLKALAQPEIMACCRPIIIGDRGIAEKAAALAGLSIRLREISSPADRAESGRAVEIISVGRIIDLVPSKPTAEGGRASAGYIEQAVRLAMDGLVDGIVTAPISKEALNLAGIPWPGHTEMLAALTGADEFAMLLVGETLRVILVTIHVPLKTVADMITRDRVVRTIRLAKRACDMLGIREPRIAVAGLNPHAGEAGIFGREEEREIRPAVQEAQVMGIPVEGPFPPDTIFTRAYRGEVDIVVCMYHDQGLIPLKMVAFDRGVNVTVGLPIIRTSPDHGTAYDIAWRGVADPSSMTEAILLASRLKL